MNKYLIRTMTIVLITMLLLSSCSQNEQDIKPIEEDKEITVVDSVDKLTEYNINIDFSPEEKILMAEQEITYTNNEGVNLENIFLHLYPNAFKSKETTPFLFDDFMRAYPHGFGEGYINVEEVKINGNETEYTIEGNGDTLLNLKLDEALKPGSSIVVSMNYEVKLPPATERFGFGDETFNFGNWYPVVAVYDDEGWNTDPYYSIGDPFYSDTANYNVNIKAPKDIVVATTGEIIKQENQGDSIIWSINAESARDFAWVASEFFKVVESEVDGIKIKNYLIDNGEYDEELEELAKEYGENSIRTFNKVFGKYPYDEYSIVQTNFPSGMEYPGIVFIGKQYYNKDFKTFLEILIVHETAHQWWYSAVGNDQIDESWLDESFASYSEVIYYDEIYGENIGNKYHKHENEDIYNERVDSLDNKSILRTLNEFDGWSDYSLLVYTKGAILLDELKEKYGKDKFYKILNTYYNKYKLKIANTEDFIEICEEVTGDELDEFFNKRLKEMN